MCNDEKGHYPTLNLVIFNPNSFSFSRGILHPNESLDTLHLQTATKLLPLLAMALEIREILKAYFNGLHYSFLQDLTFGWTLAITHNEKGKKSKNQKKKGIKIKIIINRIWWLELMVWWCAVLGLQGESQKEPVTGLAMKGKEPSAVKRFLRSLGRDASISSGWGPQKTQK